MIPIIEPLKGSKGLSAGINIHTKNKEVFKVTMYFMSCYKAQGYTKIVVYRNESFRKNLKNKFEKDYSDDFTRFSKLIKRCESFEELILAFIKFNVHKTKINKIKIFKDLFEKYKILT